MSRVEAKLEFLRRAEEEMARLQHRWAVLLKRKARMLRWSAKEKADVRKV